MNSFLETYRLIDRFLAYTIKWVDPNGMRLDETSPVWCDPTSHAGYELTKQPSMETRRSGFENEKHQERLLVEF